MRYVSICATLVLSIAAHCADLTSALPLLPCPASASDSACSPSKKELKQARSAFRKGLDLRSQRRLDDALEQFQNAAQLHPRNFAYLTALEQTRQQLVFDHLQAGNVELQAGKLAESLNDFQAALHVDPENTFAQQRVKEALGETASRLTEPARVVNESPEIHAFPDEARLDFHYKGDSRGLLTQVAGGYKIDAQIDDSVPSRPVRFNITDVDFDTAMRLANAVTHTFWIPTGDKQILVAADTPETHRQYDRMGLRTFYFPGISSATDLTNVTNVLRNIFDIKLINQDAQTSTLTIRAPQNVLDAASRFIENLDDARPQVMLDLEIFQISHTFTRKIGLGIPNQFNLFNIPAAALAGVGGQSIQSLINQLISGGGINQANSQSIAGLLAQLQSQGNNIFSQPLATFGGGLTFEGLSLGTLVAQASLNQSWVKDLQHATLRVSHGNDATFKMGTRLPIINATFAPIYNTAAISSVLQNNSFQAPFPSFSYEDIGLNLKAKPMVHGNSDISLDLEMQVRSLTGQSENGVPVIANREYKGSISLIDGQAAVVAGAVSHGETRSFTGLPGLGFLPGLNQVATANTKEVDDDELMLVITPRIVRSAMNASSEIYIAR
jgi:general secretion pathway protein D